MSNDPDRPPRLRVQRVVLDGCEAWDFTVAQGEMVALSGWSSSDLLWAIAGLRPPTTGQILVDGDPVENHAQALAADVALMPQANALASLLTAFENVLLPLAQRLAQRSGRAGQPNGEGRLEGADPAGQARRALAAVGLEESIDHLTEELSGGQQQRVAVARAIAARPRVLLADDATTDLDPANRVRVLDLLRELAGSGSAVLLASDDPAVTTACDRTVALPSSAGTA